MEFKSFNELIIKPRKGSYLCQILIEMKTLSSKTGLPVTAEIKGEKIQITALTNISDVWNSLKSKKVKK